jgi:hypothetical protein
MTQKRNETLPVDDKHRQDPASTLPGWPGYRTRSGRSGLDPIDNRTEAGHMAGVFIRGLFTATLLTRNPFYLLLFGVLGVLFLSPFSVALLSAFPGSGLPFSGWVLIGILGLVGLVLLINLFRNLFHLWKK